MICKLLYNIIIIFADDGSFLLWLVVKTGDYKSTPYVHNYNRRLPYKSFLVIRNFLTREVLILLTIGIIHIFRLVFSQFTQLCQSAVVSSYLYISLYIYIMSRATVTTHDQLTALQAALHGGIKPAMLRTWSTINDPDSSSDEDANTHINSHGNSATPRGSISASSSENSDLRVHEPVCTVLDIPRTIELRERASPGTPRRFRGRDKSDSTRLFTITPLNPDSNNNETGCIQCRSGTPLWNVLLSRYPNTRILRKYGSPYYIALHGKHWAKHSKKVALGYLHAAPHLKRQPVLAIEIHGDSLGKNFNVLGRDTDKLVSLATGRRSTKLSTVNGTVKELANWTAQIEKNVDCSMIAALIFVIDEWCDPNKNVYSTPQLPQQSTRSAQTPVYPAY